MAKIGKLMRNLRHRDKGLQSLNPILVEAWRSEAEQMALYNSAICDYQDTVIISESIKTRRKLAWMIVYRHKDFLDLVEKYVEYRKQDNNIIHIK